MNRNLSYFKGKVIDIQRSLRDETIRTFKGDLAAALRYAKAKVKILERQAGIGLMLLICLAGCDEKAPEAPIETRTIEANVSAYCACSRCCGVYSDGITASGYHIRPGDRFVAAPREYPFGTIFDIPGYGKVPCLDRGGAIKGNKLDTYHDTHEAALVWGRQYLTVKIERKK